MRYAVKRLTRSDLTLFDSQFRKLNVGNQKSINLNRSVFVDLIFPDAPNHAAGNAAQFPVTLTLFGPDGIRAPQIVTRKVIAAGGSQKNWRLNGETIHNPDDAPSRYDNIQEGDYALFGFGGNDVPDAIDLVLLSQDSAIDSAAFREIQRVVGGRVMAALSPAEVDSLAAAAPGHPAGELADRTRDELLAEAALGSTEAIQKLRKSSVRRMTAADLAAARLRAEKIGRDGEVLVSGHLKRQLADGYIETFVWESEANAVHPWDMTIKPLGGAVQRIEVKSTSGLHSRKFKISQAEILEAAESAARTEIWRISELDERGGMVRKSTNFPDLARNVRDLCAAFGLGLEPDGWTVDPSRLQWNDQVALQFDDEPEE